MSSSAPPLRPVDREDGPAREPNYYHCVLSNIPTEAPMAAVVEAIAMGPAADAPVQRLRAIGYELVPHQLHVFRERLPAKFAFVTYFLQPVAESGGEIPVEDPAADGVAARRTAAHAVVLECFEARTAAVPSEDNMAAVRFALAQPPQLLNALPFLAVLDQRLVLLDAAHCADVRKLRTFLLTKAVLDRAANFAGPETAVPVGFLDSSALAAVELAWVRAQHKQFPAVATSDLISTFFIRTLHPLIAYRDSVAVKID